MPLQTLFRRKNTGLPGNGGKFAARQRADAANGLLLETSRAQIRDSALRSAERLTTEGLSASITEAHQIRPGDTLHDFDGYPIGTVSSVTPEAGRNVAVEIEGSYEGETFGLYESAIISR